MSSQAKADKKKKRMKKDKNQEEEEQLFDIRSYQQLKAKTKSSAQQEQMTPKSQKKKKKKKTETTNTPKANNKGQKVPATPPSAKSGQKSSLRGSASGAKSKAKASTATTTPSRSPFSSKNPSPSPSSSQHQRSFFSPQATPPSNSNKKKPFSSSFLHRRPSANFSPSSAAASPSFSATPSKKRGQLLFQRVSNRGRPFSNSGFGQSVRLSTAEMSKRTRTVDVCLGGRGLADADVEAFVGWLQKSMPLIYAASFGSSSSCSSYSSSSLSSSTVEVAAVTTVTEEEKKKQAYNSEEEENKKHEAKTFETKGDSTSEEDLEDAVDEEEEEEDEKEIDVESSDGEAESERTEEDIETEDEGTASRDESGTQEEDTEDAAANEEEEKEIANDESEEVAREAKETEPNEEPREKEVLHQPQTQQKNTTSKNRILLFNLHFQENRLEDNAVKLLCEYFLSQHKEGVATVRRFYFYRNRIRDDGAKAIAAYVRQVAGELSELHLSHNRITFEGIRELLVAVKQSGEDQKKPQKSPLWMRVEYNYIAVKKLEEFLRKENISFCAAKQRKFCSTGRCLEKKVPQVHLYVYDLQYLPAEESSRLVDAKRAVSIAREKQRMKKEQQVKLPERQQAQVEGGAESQTEDEPSGGFALLNEFPTYLFLDTNAVIHMMMPQEWNRLINSNRPIMNETADGEIEEVDDGGRGEDEGFFFKNLVKKAQRREFGECFENPADRVTLIITDTVMSELDHIKTTKPHLSRCIRQLQSETGYLAQSVHLGFVEMLGAHQGEHLVSFGDRQIVEQEEDDKLSSKGGHSSRNDRRIIDVALLWNTEIGVTGNVVLITGDKGAAETAKRHNLPAASWRDLNENLLKKEKENESTEEKKLWTATRIKRCIPRALYYGGKMMAEAPVRSSKSIFQELSCAVTLTDRLAEALRFVLAENQEMKRRSEKEVGGDEYEGKEEMLFEELIRDAVESKVRWEQLIQQQRVGPYLLTQSSSASSLSSQTTASSTKEEKQQQATVGAIMQEDVATTVTTATVQETLKGNEGAEGNEDRQPEQATQEEEKNEQRGNQEIEDGKEQESKKERKDERHGEQEEDENEGEDGKEDRKEERHGEEGTMEEEIQKEVRQEQTEGTTATKEQTECPEAIKSVPLFEAVEPKEHTSVQEQESKEPPSSLQVPNDELPSSPSSTSSHSSED
ncbi:VPS37 C-terminal domain-containing protein [Balamuthia mandrillaris]